MNLAAVALSTLPTDARSAAGPAQYPAILPVKEASSSSPIVWRAELLDNGRWSHSLVVDDSGIVYLFGGWVDDRPSTFGRSNELMTFSPETNAWSIALREPGSWPLPRSELGLALAANDDLLIIGGSAGPGARLSCLDENWRLSRNPDGTWGARPLSQEAFPLLTESEMFSLPEHDVIGLIPGGCQPTQWDFLITGSADGLNWGASPFGDSGPIGQDNIALGADRANGVVYTWGGNPRTYFLSESVIRAVRKVRRWNTTSGAWDILTDGTTGPEWRNRPVSAFSTLSNLFIVFGGDVLRPGGNRLYGDLWAFDPESGTWHQLSEDDSTIARTLAAGVYLPRQGALFVAGGRDVPVTLRSNSVRETFLMPIEHRGLAAWTATPPGQRGIGKRKLRVELEAMSPSRVVPGSVAIVEGSTGRVLVTATKFVRLGGRALQVDFESNWRSIDEIVAKGDAFLTGRVDGSIVKFAASVPPPPQRPGQPRFESTSEVPSAGDIEELEGDPNTVIVHGTGGRCAVRFSAAGQISPSLSVHDIRGRRVPISALLSRATTTTGEDYRFEFSTSGLVPGVYFVRVRGNDGSLRSARFVHLDR